jgi:hypothetical protein
MRFNARHPKFFLFSLLFLWGGFSSGWAQSASDPVAESIDSNPIRALTVGFEEDLRDLHVLDANLQSAGSIRLVLRGYSRSFVAPITEGRILIGIAAGQDEEGEAVYEPIASIPWSPAYTNRALIFIPKSFLNQPDFNYAYLVRPIDMSPGSFAPGTARIVNFSPITVYLRFGEHRMAVEAGRSTSTSRVSEVLPGNMVYLNVYHLVGEEPNTVMESRIRYLDDLRYLIVVYPDFINRKLGVASILDYGTLF